MPTGLKIALGFLYGLLFMLFATLPYDIHAGRWLIVHAGGWVTLGATLALLLVIVGTVWVINRINRAWSLFDQESSWSAPEAHDMEYLISTSKPSPFVQTEITGPPAETRRP